MFAGLGRLVYRRRLSCLALALGFAVFAVMWGVGAFGHLKNGGFEDPGAESTMVTKLAAQYFGGSPDIVVVYRSDAMKVDDQRFHGAISAALARLPHDKVAELTTFWSSHSPLLVSKDRHATYAVIKLRGDDPAKQRGFEAIENQLAVPGFATKVGGPVPMGKEFNTQVAEDLGRAEMISLPLLLVLLVFVFGSLAAAVLPLIVGIFAILGALTILRLMTMVTDVSSLSFNVITMLGLGLAIDYSLFVLRRFREEMTRGVSTETALANTMATAGRTVAFSGITVATSLAGLLLFPQMFLRSVGLGGIAVVIVAMIAALVLLPTLLALLGRRVDAVSMPWRQKGRRARPKGAWQRLARSVMRRPLVYFLAVVTLLAVMVTPFLHVKFGNVDTRVLPTTSESRQTIETLHRDFPQGVMEPVDVVVTGSLSTATVNTYLGDLRKLPGVTGADISGVGRGGTAARISVRYAGDPMSDTATSIVKDVRGLAPPAGIRSVDVGGTTAAQMDLMDSLKRTLPWMALVVVAVTCVLLFAAFGSVVLPLKAVVMNVLSLGASFGAIVWAFQDGHLAGPLNFTSTGTVEATSMVLILAVVFGLSMDYEVFLLSRVREEWDRTHDNTAAVAAGMQRTGGIITSAALLFLVVIGAFSMAGISIVKLLGVGMFVAVVVDASLVRALLVPATMRALGAANWWLPGPLAWLHRHIDMRESDEVPAHTPRADRLVAADTGVELEQAPDQYVAPQPLIGPDQLVAVESGAPVEHGFAAAPVYDALESYTAAEPYEALEARTAVEAYDVLDTRLAAEPHVVAEPIAAMEPEPEPAAEPATAPRRRRRFSSREHLNWDTPSQGTPAYDLPSEDPTPTNGTRPAGALPNGVFMSAPVPADVGPDPLRTDSELPEPDFPDPGYADAGSTGYGLLDPEPPSRRPEEEAPPAIAPGWEPLLNLDEPAPAAPPEQTSPESETDVTTNQHISHHERDIVPNPDGPGWHWKTPEDDHARW